MDGVNVALGNRGMTVQAARQCVKDSKEWRALVHMELNEFHAAIFTVIAYFTVIIKICSISLRPKKIYNNTKSVFINYSKQYFRREQVSRKFLLSIVYFY